MSKRKKELPMQLEYDPQRRCGCCGTLFSLEEWRLAYVGQMPGIENHVVVHDDCFIAVWNQKPLPRALLPVGVLEFAV